MIDEGSFLHEGQGYNPRKLLKFTCKILYSEASWNDNMGCNFIYDPKEHGVCAAVFWLSQISQIKGGP